MENSFFAFSATETGYNHLKINKVCEDASDFYDDEKLHIGVVADGHGSDNYPRTDRGARFAVDAAIHCIVEFVENADPQQVVEDERHGYALLTQLAKSILRDWYQAVENDYNKYPFEEKELEKVSEKYRKHYISDNEKEKKPEKAYGCTLIAYAVTEGYSFGLQIGDGKCVVINQYGDFTEPIPWDDDCQMNVTTSICDSDAIDEFRFCVSEVAPAAVFCGSDGIDDSYAGAEEMYALYRSILKIVAEHGIEVGKNEIKEYMPVLTKRGSGDDVSVATVIDTKKITELNPIFDVQTLLFNRIADLDAKKNKLTATGEKMDVLYKKIRDFYKKDDNSQNRLQMNDLVTLSEELKKSIGADEQQIAELQERYQTLIHDMKRVSSTESSSVGKLEVIDESSEDEKAGNLGDSVNKDTSLTEARSDDSNSDIMIGQAALQLEETNNTEAIQNESEKSTAIVELVREEA